MTTEKTFTERRVYKFMCEGCGMKHAQSFKRRVAVSMKCRKCRSGKVVDDRQLSLIVPIIQEPQEV